MRLINLSSEAYGAIQDQEFASSESRMAAYQAAGKVIQAGLNTPIDLGVCQKVTYSDKTDRYMVTFSGGKDRSAVLKASTEVAEFLTLNLNVTQAGSWLGRMQDGMLVDVNLLSY